MDDEFELLVDDEKGVDEFAGARVERYREGLLQSVASQSLDTLERKVAWILNNYAAARDSDVALALKYWEIFEKDLFDGRALNPGNLYKLARTNSLTRCRAKIQNTYRLFQASAVVRKRRGKLSREEKAKAIEESAVFPTLAVFADESGKTDNHVVVGSVWVLDGMETLKITELIRKYKDKHSVEGEIHFKDISGINNAEFYIGLIDLLIANASAMCFKVIAMNRRGGGHVQQILDKLYFLLLKRGVEHEVSSGRTPLPRRLQVWKDMDNGDNDKLLMANIKEQLAAASLSQFNNELHLDDFTAIDSLGADLMQIADLLASSVSRVYNHPTEAPSSPKDLVAHYLLESLGIPKDPNSDELISDMAVRLNLL